MTPQSLTSQSKPPTELTTARLKLRQWTIGDYGPLANFLALKELNRYRGGAMDREAAWEYLSARAGEWNIRGYGCFALEELSSGSNVGFAGLWHPPDLGEPELMWSLYPDFHGNGYATEAARAVQVWAHETLELDPLMSFVHPDNAASIAVAERLGASNTGLTELCGETRFFYRHITPQLNDSSIEMVNEK